jgi:hypothetical protein
MPDMYHYPEDGVDPDEYLYPPTEEAPPTPWHSRQSRRVYSQSSRVHRTAGADSGNNQNEAWRAANDDTYGQYNTSYSHPSVGNEYNTMPQYHGYGVPGVDNSYHGIYSSPPSTTAFAPSASRSLSYGASDIRPVSGAGTSTQGFSPSFQEPLFARQDDIGTAESTRASDGMNAYYPLVFQGQQPMTYEPEEYPGDARDNHNVDMSDPRDQHPGGSFDSVNSADSGSSTDAHQGSAK